ncbi:MAG: hypothetical protein RIC82_06030, partial [Parvibaculum sp.]
AAVLKAEFEPSQAAASACFVVNVDYEKTGGRNADIGLRPSSPPRFDLFRIDRRQLRPVLDRRALAVRLQREDMEAPGGVVERPLHGRSRPGPGDGFAKQPPRAPKVRDGQPLQGRRPETNERQPAGFDLVAGCGRPLVKKPQHGARRCRLSHLRLDTVAVAFGSGLLRAARVGVSECVPATAVLRACTRQVLLDGCPRTEAEGGAANRARALQFQQETLVAAARLHTHQSKHLIEVCETACHLFNYIAGFDF